jgi:hypothetical protein
LPLEKSRQQRLWLYRDSLGSQHTLTTIRHNRLQKGARYFIRASGAELNGNGFICEKIGKE